MGSVFTITSGCRIWFSIHSCVRCMETPFRSGHWNTRPYAWQATQPLLVKSALPCVASAASTAALPARGPASYFDCASSVAGGGWLAPGSGVAGVAAAADVSVEVAVFVVEVSFADLPPQAPIDSAAIRAAKRRRSRFMTEVLSRGARGDRSRT